MDDRYSLIESWCDEFEYDVDLNGTSLPDEFSEALDRLDTHPLLSFARIRPNTDDFIQYVRELFDDPLGSLVLYYWKDAMLEPLMTQRDDPLDSFRDKLQDFFVFLRQMASAAACLHPPIGRHSALNRALERDPVVGPERAQYGLYAKDNIETIFNRIQQSFGELQDHIMTLLTVHLVKYRPM